MIIVGVGVWNVFSVIPHSPKHVNAKKRSPPRLLALLAARDARDARDASRNRDLNRQPPFSVYHMIWKHLHCTLKPPHVHFLYINPRNGHFVVTPTASLTGFSGPNDQTIDGSTVSRTICGRSAVESMLNTTEGPAAGASGGTATLDGHTMLPLWTPRDSDI